MSDHRKFNQLTPTEIDRLLAGSPVPAPRRIDCARTPCTEAKVILTEEDLALLEETAVSEQLSA